jgi:hypothetical protein
MRRCSSGSSRWVALSTLLQPDVTDDSITLHSSWRGVVGGTLMSFFLAFGGLLGALGSDFNAVPVVLMVIGLVLVGVMLLDFPVSSRFTAVGVQRRMMIRRQNFEWSHKTRLSRSRPSVVKMTQHLEHGGLALVKGRRRYLLVDRPESATEFDVMRKIIDSGTVDVGQDFLLRPGDKVAPTWLYRRSRWRPEPPDGR